MECMEISKKVKTLITYPIQPTMSICFLIQCTYWKTWSSLIYNTSGRHERHEYDTSATRATRVRHEWDTSPTRVRHEWDTSATRTSWVRQEWKILLLLMTRVKICFQNILKNDSYFINFFASLIKININKKSKKTK